jgi:hypothetical protein
MRFPEARKTASSTSTSRVMWVCRASAICVATVRFQISS